MRFHEPSNKNESANLARWALAEETPPLLSIKLISSAGLPHHVVRVEEHDTIRGGLERRLDSRDGSLLVRRRRDSEAVGVSLGWPAGLGDDNGLAAVRELGLEALNRPGKEGAGAAGVGIGVEEGVAVDGAVVGVVAQAWVGERGDEGVAGDDGSVVTGSSEERASGAHGLNDRGGGRLSAVDKLVTDGDGVDGGPVTVNSGNNILDRPFDIGDIEDALEYLHAVGLGSSDHGRDGIAVNAVCADGRVTASEPTEVRQDLVGGFAGAILVVWAVCETVPRSGWCRCVR